jgi:hypothetical protein
MKIISTKLQLVYETSSKAFLDKSIIYNFIKIKIDIGD